MAGGIRHAATRSLSFAFLRPQVVGRLPRRLADDDGRWASTGDCRDATSPSRGSTWARPSRSMWRPSRRTKPISRRSVKGSNGGGVAVAVWAPPRPTLAIATDLPDMDVYEVRVYDDKSGHRLVAAVEIVSPSNKDRPEHRRAFVAKCSDMLRDGVCVAIVDLVTTRHFNLYGDLMELHRPGRSVPGRRTSSSSMPSPVDGGGMGDDGLLEPGCIPCHWAVCCRPCRSGSPITSPSRSSWNRATRRRAGSFASHRTVTESPKDSSDLEGVRRLQHGLPDREAIIPGEDQVHRLPIVAHPLDGNRARFPRSHVP